MGIGSSVIAAIGNQFVDRGATLQIPVTVIDPDGNPLVLTASGLPAFSTFVDNGNGTGLFSFTPGVGDRGDYTITLSARDNGDGGGSDAVVTALRSFVVTARSPSEPPVLEYIGDVVAVVGQTMQLMLQARDLDQDALQFLSSGLPNTATVTPGTAYGTAIVTWTPTGADINTHTVTFTVRDNGNGGQGTIGEHSRTIDIVVRTANAAPTLTPIGSRTLTEGELFTLQPIAFDSDGDPLTYRATGLPPGR